MTEGEAPGIEIRSRLAAWPDVSDDAFVARFTDAGWAKAVAFGLHEDARRPIDNALSILILKLQFYTEADLGKLRRKIKRQISSSKKSLRGLQTVALTISSLENTSPDALEISRIEDALRCINEFEESHKRLKSSSFKTVRDAINELFEDLQSITAACDVPLKRSRRSETFLPYLIDQLSSEIENYADEYSKHMAEGQFDRMKEAARLLRHTSSNDLLKRLTTRRGESNGHHAVDRPRPAPVQS